MKERVMRVFVTGGCGFLGSHVCQFYAEKGAEVTSYDNMTKYELERTGFVTDRARKFNRDYLRGLGVKTIQADVRDHEPLMDAAQGADFIIHTAAQPAMTISWEEPRLDVTTNVLGTFNILEVARRLKVPVVSCATIHVYGNRINDSLREGEKRYTRRPAGIGENHPFLEGSLTPLHASKGAGDLYVRAFIDTYRLEAASFRLTGIYGTRQFGGEDHGWVAHFAIRSVLGRPITLFGSGKQVRDIIHARDVCEAFDAFYRTRAPGVYNIGGGPGASLSLLECVDILEAINGKRPRIRFQPDRHGDLRYFVCRIEKARKSLQWSPRIRPRQGIEEMVAWIRDHRDLFQAKER